MARKPDVVEEQIRQKREEISRKFGEMTDRASQDMREVSDSVQSALDSDTLRRTLDERPLVTLAGALGLGVVLGMASESFSLSGLLGVGASQPKVAPPSGWLRQDGKSQAGGGLMDALGGAVTGAVADEGRQMIHDLLHKRNNGDSRTG